MKHMKVVVTEGISKLSGKISGIATGAKEKAIEIWKHVNEIPYDIFGITPNNVDDLVKEGTMTCYGKAFLQAALLESEGIDWRFEYSKCPSHAIESTIKSMSDTNPVRVNLCAVTSEKHPTGTWHPPWRALKKTRSASAML